MSNDKLAEALRSLRLKFASGNDVPVPEARITRAEWEALEQAHAAEAAQALPQMTDAEHAEILAKYGTPQAAEPVRQFRVVPKGSVWTDVKDPKIWASVIAHPKSYETRVLYTHPQPAQDAKDAAHFDQKRFESAPCYLCGYNGCDYYQPCVHKCAALYHAAMAKESWR